MKAYYAHCQAIYGTPQEARDLATIEALGLSVVNPSSAEVKALLDKWKQANGNVMDFFVKLCGECDLCVFRALPDGSIPAGVAKEIASFVDAGKPVIELPSGILRRVITVDETREYLKEVGQR